MDFQFGGDLSVLHFYMFTFVQYVFLWEGSGQLWTWNSIPGLHFCRTYQFGRRSISRGLLLYFCKKKEISLLNNIGLLLHSASYMAHDVKYKTFS